MAIPSGYLLAYTHHGEWTTPTPSGNKFRACAQVYALDTGTGQSLYLRRYVEVSTIDDGGFNGTTVQLGWINPEDNTKYVRIYETGGTAIYDIAWITLPYGGSEQVKESDAFATYTGGSGTKYYSHAGFTYTVPSPTYTISYDANGGSGAPSSQIKTHNVTLTLSDTKPTRSGYTFLGWSTSRSATSVLYNAGGSYTANVGVTLYAIWKKTITVSYDANGGSGAPSSQSGDVYNTDTSISIILSTVEPTRSGYTFLGWSTSRSATSPAYNKGTRYSFSNSVVLYAVWEKKATLSVFVNGEWKTASPYSPERKQGYAHVFVNGSWKQGVT